MTNRQLQEILTKYDDDAIIDFNVGANKEHLLVDIEFWYKNGAWDVEPLLEMVNKNKEEK